MIQEADMIPIIEEYFQSEGYLTFTEVSVGGSGHGIADIVAVKLNQDKVLQRINNKQYQSLKTEVSIDILKNITDSEIGTHIDKIEDKFCYTKKYLKRNLLSDLIEGHFIQEIKRDTYVKINNILPLASEIIAIEAKKEAWRSATQQARRYQTYANRVYVAILDDFSHRVEKERLQKNNIGLLTVNMDKRKVKPLWKSRKRKAINEVTHFLAHEAIWERIRMNPFHVI